MQNFGGVAIILTAQISHRDTIIYFASKLVLLALCVRHGLHYSFQKKVFTPACSIHLIFFVFSPYIYNSIKMTVERVFSHIYIISEYLFLFIKNKSL